MILRLALCLVFAHSGAFAATFVFERDVEVAALGAELRSATGLDFIRLCAESHCRVNGHIISGGGRVTIEVYETSVQAAPWIAPVRLSPEMSKAIDQAVRRHDARKGRDTLRQAESRMRALAEKWKAGTITPEEKEDLLRSFVLRGLGV